MSDQIEQAAPTGNEGSGDPAFDAALAEASAETPAAVETPSEAAEVPEAVEAPPENQDFTLSTLENGQREMRLATGQVYRGKDDAELYTQLAKAQVSATRHINEMNGKASPAPVSPIEVKPNEVDPTALAIADLMAPAFGLKSGADLVAAFAEQQRITQTAQEDMASRAANMEAANFFRAVPEFSKSQADADKIDQFLQTNELPFNARTAEMAYHTLKAKGEMTALPVVNKATAPKNGMPAPPQGTAPANTGKGATTEADLYSMTTEQLEQLLINSATA